MTFYSDFDENILAKHSSLESHTRTHHPSNDSSVPYPLPMPAYGGYFAPLSDILPPNSDLPNPPYQRCNLAVMLVTDLILEGINIDWTGHLPLMLHIIMLGRYAKIIFGDFYLFPSLILKQMPQKFGKISKKYLGITCIVI